MKIPGIQAGSSSLDAQQTQLFNQLVESLQPSQAIWISGYLAGVSNAQLSGTLTPSTPAPSGTGSLTILYGSQTGNSEGIAKEAAKKAAEKGLQVVLKSMGDYKTKQIAKEKHLMVVISTHGEGEPPDEAMELYEFIQSKKAPKMTGAQFAVLGLGDTSYEHFCQMGVDFDKRLEELGGTRILDRVDCDVDYEEQAETWVGDAITYFSKELGSSATQMVTATSSVAMPVAGKTYSKKAPFVAEVLEKVQLNGRGSNKETYHIALSLEGSGIVYQPGDALGVIPQNDPLYVDELIKAGGFDNSIKDRLLSELEITTITRPVIKTYAEKSGDKSLLTLVEDKDQLNEYLDGRELIDLLQDYPIKGLTGEAFCDMLRKLPPRLYSIASSLEANPEEVHLTVGVTRYETHGRKRSGVCSCHFADRLNEGDKVPVYVQPNTHFRLPDNPDAAVIMIGPGTGIAPFRAFVEQRDESGAGGKNWLFFGDQHFTTDFLYQVEWQRFLKDGSLTRMDVAFSRDQDEKIYVQDRMLEHGKDLYKWLEEGAHLYVCGDESKMAPDVHAALLNIIQEHGNKSSEEAEAYLKKMQKEHRYQRDVY